MNPALTDFKRPTNSNCYRRNSVIANLRKTRPDTWPIPVADGWAGAEMHVFIVLDSCAGTDGPMDEQTDGQMLL